MDDLLSSAIHLLRNIVISSTEKTNTDIVSSVIHVDGFRSGSDENTSVTGRINHMMLYRYGVVEQYVDDCICPLP